MTATTVTPEIVRVFFLRKIGRRLFFSFGVRALIMSVFEGISCRWCFAATSSLTRFTSSWVGLGKSSSEFKTSRAASFLSKSEIPQ